MKCPKCNKEFADGLHNCPYCGHGILQNDSEGKFNVPKFTGSYKMANPRVKNQKEALKKINESNKINRGVSENHVNFVKPPVSTPASSNGSNSVTSTKKIITTTTATNVSVSGGTSDNVASARKKTLTREDLETMQRNVAARSHSQSQAQTENHPNTEGESHLEHNTHREIEEPQDDIATDAVTNDMGAENVEESEETPKRRMFGGKKEKKEKKKDKSNEEQQPDNIDYAESSEESYDVNLDGYYDDLIPELAHQINKIPQENIIKVVFIVIFVVIMCFIILYTS